MHFFPLASLFQRKKKRLKLSGNLVLWQMLKEITCIFKNNRTEVEYQRYNLGSKY